MIENFLEQFRGRVVFRQIYHIFCQILNQWKRSLQFSEFARLTFESMEKNKFNLHLCIQGQNLDLDRFKAMNQSVLPTHERERRNREIRRWKFCASAIC